jgi:hypothetical protein
VQRNPDIQTRLMAARIYRAASRYDLMRREAHEVLDRTPSPRQPEMREIIQRMLGPTALEPLEDDELEPEDLGDLGGLGGSEPLDLPDLGGGEPGGQLQLGGGGGGGPSLLGGEQLGSPGLQLGGGGGGGQLQLGGGGGSGGGGGLRLDLGDGE